MYSIHKVREHVINVQPRVNINIDNCNVIFLPNLSIIIPAKILPIGFGNMLRLAVGENTPHYNTYKRIVTEEFIQILTFTYP